VSAGLIGGIVGGIVAIAAALIAFFLLKRRKDDVPDNEDEIAECSDPSTQDGTFNGDDAVFVSEYGLSDHVNQVESIGEDDPAYQNDEE
jgi:hypothetical protein